MKIAIYIITAPLTSAATISQLPIAFTATSPLEEIKKIQSPENHPWNPSMPLPETIGDTGMIPPVRLTSSEAAFDGGSRFYMFEDSVHNFLVIRSESPLYGDPKTKKVYTRTDLKLTLGIKHLGTDFTMGVPLGSKCEKFLIALIADGVRDFKKSKTESNQAPEPTGIVHP